MPDEVIKKERPILKVIRDKANIYFHKGDVCLVRYNLKQQTMQKKREYKYKEDVWYNVESQYNYFSGYRMDDLVIEEEKFAKLIKQSAEANNSCSSLSSFISRMVNALVYENYINEGINYNVSYRRVGGYWSYGRRKYNHFKHPLEDYDKHIIKFFKQTGYEVTKRFEDMYFSNPELWKNVILIINSLDISNQKKFDTIYNIMERRTDFYTLINEYKYDVKALLNYLLNYLQPFENLRYQEGIRILNDYYRMASLIGRNVKKYPKYLKSMHDIIQANYNSYEREYDELAFIKLMNPKLEHIGQQFIVINPHNSKDIIAEGTNLNHCVSSYVDNIIERKTYIFFLRDKKFPEESLITLELIGDRITQAKGSYNRAPNKEEKAFLQSYCKTKKLELGVSL